MPEPAPAPELLPTPRDPEGIRIGGTAGQIDVNFCLNPMCGNFGLSGPQAEKRGQGYRLKLTKDPLALRMECLGCGGSRRLYNNRAVDHMFLQILKNTLRHEYCPKADCENHRVNFHETFHLRKGQKSERYKRKDKSPNRVSCLKCDPKVNQSGGKDYPTFRVGTPWRRHVKQGRSSPTSQTKYLDDLSLFMKLVCNNCGPSNVINIMDCPERNYYTVLSTLADTCNSISGTLMMRLQDQQRYKKNRKHKSEIRLYSDILLITLNMGGREERYHSLEYLVTSTDYNGSFVVLAATLMFYGVKDKKFFALREAICDKREDRKLECHQEYAHLHWEGVLRRGKQDPNKPLRKRTAVPMKGGYFVVTCYGTLGHFLTLRKMLSGFHQINHYVDNEDVLRTAAVTAFSDRILENRCDVVCVSHQKDLSREDAAKSFKKNYKAAAGADMPLSETAEKPDSRSLRKKGLQNTVTLLGSKFLEAAQAYKEEQAKKKLSSKRKKLPDPLAKIFSKAASKKVPRGDDKEFSLWVRDPISPTNEPERHFCWMTRRPSGKNTRHEVELYLNGKLQPVDTYFSSLRSLSSTIQRPQRRAGGGHVMGFGSQASTFPPVFSEISLIRFNWNFMRRRRSEKGKNREIARARELGILDEEALVIDKAPAFHREVFEYAREITECLGT